MIQRKSTLVRGRRGGMTAAQADSQTEMAMLKQIRAQRAAALMREVELVARASTFVSINSMNVVPAHLGN